MTFDRPISVWREGKEDQWTDEHGIPVGGPVTEILVELSCPPPNLAKNVTETVIVGETVVYDAGWERGRCVVAHTRRHDIPEGGVVRYEFPYEAHRPTSKPGPRFVAPTNPPVRISPGPPELASNAP